MNQVSVLDMSAISEELSATFKINPQKMTAILKAFCEPHFNLPWFAKYDESAEGLPIRRLIEVRDAFYYAQSLAMRRYEILNVLKENVAFDVSSIPEWMSAKTRMAIEDCYLPYRPKPAHVKAAYDLNLSSCVERFLTEPIQKKENVGEVPHLSQDILEKGVRTILFDKLLSSKTLLKTLREAVLMHAKLVVTPLQKNTKKNKNTNMSPAVEHEELFPIQKLSSARLFTLFRQKKMGEIALSFSLPGNTYGREEILKFLALDETALTPWGLETIDIAWRTKLWPTLEVMCLLQLGDLVEQKMLAGMVRSLRAYLRNAPIYQGVLMVLQAESRQNVSIGIVSNTGMLLEHMRLPLEDTQDVITTLAKCVVKYGVSVAVVVHNKGFREVTRLVTKLIKMYPDFSLSRTLMRGMGGERYAVSKHAIETYPDLSETARALLFVGRCFQYPLRELSLETGTLFFEDALVSAFAEKRLFSALETVFEECLYHHGVALNLASQSLLQRVVGIHESLAKAIVTYRDEKGPYLTPEALKHVPGMTTAIFEKAAPFFMIFNAEDKAHLTSVKLPKFSETVDTLEKLEVGMVLEGMINHVSTFGAFIDIGLHHDGLIHLSSLKKRFGADALLCLQPGDVLRVKVLAYDRETLRISLGLLEETAPLKKKNIPTKKENVPKTTAPLFKKREKTRVLSSKPPVSKPKEKASPKVSFNTAMADAFLKLKQKS